jgi:hypothetical protein
MGLFSRFCYLGPAVGLQLRGGVAALSSDGGTGSPGKRLKNNKLHRDSEATQALARTSKRPKMELLAGLRIIGLTRRPENMLVERGLQVMNAEVVGEAYTIASNYLRRTGAIPDTFATDERLLEIIVQMFQRGEFNRIRLANKAIVKFEAETYIA